MKSKLIFLALLATLVLGAFPIQNAWALSCVPTFPVIGVVGSISVKESYTEIVLDKFYTFNNSDWGVNDTISIDRYENIVKEYVKNNFKLTEKPTSEYSEWVGKISVPTSAFNQTQIKNGDIIINGPPFHVCSYRFTGLFTRDGKLRNAIVNDSYQDYSYRNSKLKVEAGRELECDKNDRCKMEVNFNLDGKAFKLIPGQSYKPTANPIKSIFLLDSSDLKKRSDGTTIFDWGFGTYVIFYVLDFSDSVIQPTPSSKPTPSPTPEPEPSPEPTPPVENLNFFQKIWRWLVSLFG
jgi:hypothetical protein